MKNGFCTDGLRRVAILAMTVILLAFGAACGGEDESQCDDGYVWANDRDQQPACLLECDEANPECPAGRECDSRGLCIMEAEQSNQTNNQTETNQTETNQTTTNQTETNQTNNQTPDNSANWDCDPQVACEAFCEAQSGRCVEETCTGTAQITTEQGTQTVDGEGLGGFEVSLCVSGFTNADIPACLDRASVSEAACQQVEAEAEQLALRDCSGEEAVAHVCSELWVNATGIGDIVFDVCDQCVPPNTAGPCETDTDCHDSSRGLCADEHGEHGFCVATCNGWGGFYAGSALLDASCADELGICTDYTQTADGWIGFCLKGCLGHEDCPQSLEDGYTCVPAFASSAGTTGICEVAQCADDTECEDGECRDGNCMAECVTDAECSYGPCGGDGFCEIEWGLAFGADD